MASNLSEDEFHRMQLQLIELRTANYQLDDQGKRKDRELQSLKEQVATLDKDLLKANKAVSKSKKAREVELLIQENDTLQRKLHSQEEDFRLQNTTLMQELSLLVSTNEELEKKVKSVEDGGGKGTEDNEETSELQSEVRRLQAQNTVLQKNLTACQEKYEQELAELRNVTTGDTSEPADSEHNESLQSENADESMDTTDSASSDRLAGERESLGKKLEEAIKETSNLKLNLDTEKEENRILKDQLQQLEKNSKEQTTTLQEEVEKLQDKLKKKQESFVQLQDEKEKLYKESSSKLEEVTSSKDRDIHYFRELSSKHEEEISKLKQSYQDLQTQSSHKESQLENTIKELQGQVNSASAENAQQLENQNSKLQEEIAQLKISVDKFREEKADLETQLQGTKTVNAESLQQLKDIQLDRDSQIQALQEASRIAEKRKNLLDELAIKYQTESEQHREKVRKMEESHQEERDELLAQCKTKDEKSKNTQQTLERYRQEVEDLKGKVQSLYEAKGWLERRLKESEESLETKLKEFETSMASTVQEHENTLAELREEHQEIEKSLNTEIDGAKLELDNKDIEISALTESVNQLQQEINDGIDAKKIHEKKGASMIKDLKRQLKAEQKRTEKLQERLQELLADTKHSKSMDELLRPVDPDAQSRSSLSSWSGLSGGKDTSISTPNTQSPMSDSGPNNLEAENNELCARVAELQEQSSNLQEQVSILESSNAAMAEDILQKQAIIEHYVKEGRPAFVQPSSSNQDKLTLKRVVDFVKDKGDENMKEMNRKLQRVLEETLTKNMHLQQDMELLSQELARVSGKAEKPTISGTQATTNGEVLGGKNET